MLGDIVSLRILYNKRFPVVPFRVMHFTFLGFNSQFKHITGLIINC